VGYTIQRDAETEAELKGWRDGEREEGGKKGREMERDR
jgi:hypothetical protein